MLYPPATSMACYAVQNLISLHY